MLVPTTAALLTYLVGVRTVAGQWLDMFVLRRTLNLVPPVIASWAPTLGRAPLLVVLAVAAAVLAIAAMRHRHWRHVGCAVVTVAGVVPLTWYLRTDVLTRPDLGTYGYAFNTMPSTHASAALALLVCLVLLWPTPRPPWVVAVVVAVPVLVFVGNVVTLAHRPSDVVASAFLVLGWSAAVAALVRPRLHG